MKTLQILLLVTICHPAFASVKVKNKLILETKTVKRVEASQAKKFFLKEYKKTLSRPQLIVLKKKTLEMGSKAVPALIEVMKNSNYPDKNKWMATFMLGKIMGKKSAAFISKFLRHPSWVMRMASLKTLLALRQTKYKSLYVDALKDKSFIVRNQALENIRTLKLSELAPHVWAMLYDKRNYYNPKTGNRKRTNIIRKVIKAVGDLKFKKAGSPMIKMIQKKKYIDIFKELDYSLTKITGKKSPAGSALLKRNYWKRIGMGITTI